MKELIMFEERELLGKKFRMYGDKENPLFLANDVATWIEYSVSNVNKLVKIVDEEEKLIRTIFLSGQNREVWFLTEDGLYEVLMQSRKPIAKAFKKEVKKIVKQIRTTGGYLPRNKVESDEDFLRQSFSILYKTIEKQDRIIEEQKPMVDFANILIASPEDGIDIATFAKLINDEKVFKGGRNKLFAYLKDNGYLMKDNTPYQRFIDNGIFKFKKYIHSKPCGDRVGYKTLITSKGQAYLIEKMRSKV